MFHWTSDSRDWDTESLNACETSYLILTTLPGRDDQHHHWAHYGPLTCPKVQHCEMEGLRFEAV